MGPNPGHFYWGLTNVPLSLLLQTVAAFGLQAPYASPILRGPPCELAWPGDGLP
jgi:hypothetical protein